MRNTILLLLSIFFFYACKNNLESPKLVQDYTTWRSYLGGPDRNHYSTLSQITPENVTTLEVAWSYASEDYGQMQMNPIIIDTILYGVSAALRAFALHAATGEELWRFGDSLKVWHSTSRGVSYWEKGADKRILYTVGSELYALNALTGQPIPSFGENGKIDLRSGLPERAKNAFVISNTPGTIYEDLIVMPLRLGEDVGAAPGDIMAFNVITGAVAWVFHTIPYPDESGSETWEDRTYIDNGTVGAANNWAGMAVDEALGIIYVPTGSAAPDFYGGIRKGSNLYANCLLALNARTGERLWHFQFTHHDIWDRDLPAPPNLITVTHQGKKIAAVAQVTKQGYVFLFDRKTGVPLFDIEERPVPSSTLEGETPWPTQPFPVKPKPFARQSNELTENDISPYAPNREELITIFNQSAKRLYAPPALTPVFLLPGYDGAAEWGGAAADPNEGILYVNSNEMAWLLQMEKQEGSSEEMPLGQRVYTTYCASCHQKDRKGLAASGFPSLVDIEQRRTTLEVSDIITQGKGMMTGFPQIPTTEREALLNYLFDIQDKMEVLADVPLTENVVPYTHTGYTKFLDAAGNPGISPPWGTLHAINLNTGNYLWSIPFGESETLNEAGNTPTGTENYGGPVVTANGLLFIGATKDGFFRAFDKKTGKVLWQYQLPAAAFATPATYAVNGKQYVVIACGGEKLGTPKGNKIIAFALP
ncbi:PQQ-binding-like beta-propeller repeat protein [Arenibacter sp. GZD96]|uniref:outer membrane protein assembly factor BamB family protein n=1 Tax=Aurantibrevibacter litoralis TaxID=3106030 RepID=UPI002AFEBC20|nr:PQQ-binding-like beta-propeller repeat protein [Arenibacter sp. GZD-96]MEA1785723.1 PQQ-binding-like beta-propeller repeat protein [Arenibacter sp. GZD-96]